MNRATLQFIREGARPGGTGHDRDLGVGRHRLLFSAAANLAEHGVPAAVIADLLLDPALDCGLPPREVERTICNAIASVHPLVREACQLFDAEVTHVMPPPPQKSGGVVGGTAGADVVRVRL